jgi:hypothetical protein
MDTDAASWEDTMDALIRTELSGDLISWPRHHQEICKVFWVEGSRRQEIKQRSYTRAEREGAVAFRPKEWIASQGVSDADQASHRGVPDDEGEVAFQALQRGHPECTVHRER